MFGHIRIIKKSCQGKFITVGTLPIKVTPTEETHGDGTATTVDLALCVNPSLSRKHGCSFGREDQDHGRTVAPRRRRMILIIASERTTVDN